jgi:ABC-2 type transport system permease protein
MDFKKIAAIIRREYVERIRSKGFWIGTMIVPVFLGVIIGLQVYTTSRTSGVKHIAVVDLTGRLFAPLEKELTTPPSPPPAGEPERTPGRREHFKFDLNQIPVHGNLDAVKKSLQQRVLNKTLDAYVILDPAEIERGRAEYYATSVSQWTLQDRIHAAISAVVRRDRLVHRGVPPELLSELDSRVDMRTIKVTEHGETEEKGAGLIVAIIFFFLMYTTLIMYGYYNLRGVVEEKTNRIVEIVIASVRPIELMLGKIVGIGLVGLTQYCIWIFLAMNLSLSALAAMMIPGEDLGVARIPLATLGAFMVFFLLGYFFYASIYTAIGAPFNSDQDAQQLSFIPTMLIVSAVVMYPAVLNNPNGGFAIAGSLIPFSSPLIMFLRIAVAQPPAWQIAACIGILILSIFALAWFAGKIYRVGILMYGKKPTVPEILRWVRYGESRRPAPAKAEA